MTINRFIPVIHIHPILLLFIAISFLTGTFMELFIILAIVLFHEMGHYTMATVFKWRIRSIMLWIFGGVMETDEHGNRPLNEEMLVTIAGPFQHVLIYGVVMALSAGELLSPATLELMYHYNTLILLFNLLPIWPLDGGKFLFLLLSSFLPYRQAYHTVIKLSLIACVLLLVLQLFFFPFTLSAFLIVIFLLKENRTEWKQRYYVFMRFLLKRYQNTAPVKDIQPIIVPHQSSLIDVFALFQRDKKHSIYIQFSENERKPIDENDCLHYFFHDKQYSKPIGEIVRYRN